MQSLKLAVFVPVCILGIFVCSKVINADTYVNGFGAPQLERWNATLNCTYFSNASIQDETTLQWSCMVGIKAHLVLRNREGSIATYSGCPGMNLKDRVSFVGGTGDASMLIRDVRTNDAGTFQCKVSIDDSGGGADTVEVQLIVKKSKQVFMNPKPTSRGACTFLQASGQVSGVQNVTEVWWTEANNNNFTVIKTMFNGSTVETSVTVHNPTPDYNYTFTLHTNHPIAGRPEINSTRTMQCQVTTTVQTPISNGITTLHVPAVTLLVLASVTIIASVVLIVFVVHFALACKKENASRRTARKPINKRTHSDQTSPNTTENRTSDKQTSPKTTENKTSDKQRAFSPKMWLFVVFGVVAIIIGVTFIAIGSIDLHSNGSPGVSAGIALCIIFLIMNIFFIIGFIKHKIKGGLVAPFCSTTKKDVTSNGTKEQQTASRDSSAVKESRATPQDISLQGNPNKGGNYNLTDEEKGSNPQFPLIDTSKMIHTDKPRKLPPLPGTHLPPLDEGNASPRKKKKKKAKRKSQEGED